MSEHISGEIRGLAPSQKRKIEKIAHRKLGNDELVSLDLAREIFRTATELRRRIGVLVTREGEIVDVIVGTKQILYLPDLGRYRFGKGRLRQLRLIFSDLSNSDGSKAVLPHDIYTDLEKLRLDMVVSVREVGNQMRVTYAHILPGHDPSTAAVHTETLRDVGQIEMDFSEFMSELDDQLTGEMIARGVDGGGDKAMLIGVYPKGTADVEESMAELRELARTAGVKIAGEITQRRDIDPRTLLGKGKLEEVVLHALRLGVNLLIFDGELRPGQWRAIVNSTEIRVIDRSMLILDIFSMRASSGEGRLQVELAQLKYNLPRLVEKDAGLSRLSGGIGGRGPGETKLEIGRRRIRDRIVELEKRIDVLQSQRGLRRRKRQENEVPLVAILGYTNVGKSSLFNALTKSDVVVENKLFATLDPATRKLVIPAKKEGEYDLPLVLSDTVGFIRHLPDELYNAFRATLEELNDASLLVHVLDASAIDIEHRQQAVIKILEQIGLLKIPIITVVNKIDLVEEGRIELLEREFEAIAVSAVKRTGFDRLLAEIRRRLELAKGEKSRKAIEDNEELGWE